MQRLLVFQHLPLEHPGVFLEFLARDGVQVDTVELDAGQPIPALDPYDALWVMGGPMDVWQEDVHPWLRAEKAAIREAVLERGMPYLGLCLGHQLLAEACGGAVALLPEAEVGLFDVDYTPAAADDPLLGGLGSERRCFQWHAAGVTRLPPDATLLASSTRCAHQAMRVGERAWGLQYHVEITARTIEDWSTVPEYRAALEQTLGPSAVTDLRAAVLPCLPRLRAVAEAIYGRFRHLACT
jgi:GMP synthase-like glutamine amidotransferase